jgi:hypothetical protein
VLIGFTTDATHYVDIYTASGSRHDGTWNETKYRLDVADAVALDIREDYVRILGLLMGVSSASVARATIAFGGITATTNLVEISNSIIRTHANASFTGTGIDSGDTDLNYKFKNLVVHERTANAGSRGLSISAATGYVHNCTIKSSSGTGVRNIAGTMHCQNVVVSAPTCFTVTAGTVNRNYVITSDATADDAGGTGNQINISEASMTFTDAANTDFHISSGSTLKDQGVDLSGDANLPVTDDIGGQARDATPDVGAHEYVTPDPILGAIIFNRNIG